jgi:PrtD family type I secretion system ABC transporter
MQSAPAPSKTIPRPAGPDLPVVRQAVIGGYAGILALSAVFNLFMLSGSLFMLLVYDRVLPSGSLPTLIALFALVAGIYVGLGALETLRLRAATRIADRFGDEAGPAVMRAAVAAPAMTEPGRAMRPVNAMQDFDRLRGFIGSPAAIALCDLPWLPIYLAIAFLFHPALGTLALGGVALLVVLTAFGDRLAQEPARLAGVENARRARLFETAMRNAGTIAGLGMRGAFSGRFAATDQALRSAVRGAADSSALFIGLSRGIRLLLQSASLALGAYLALRNEITPGMIIAVSIITSRAMAPVEQAIVHWRGFVAARQAWLRLGPVIHAAAEAGPRTGLPAPAASLAVTGLSVDAPVSGRRILTGVTFSVRAGSAVGVIGPSGAGKSTLARALVAVWPAAAGTIRLDGAELSQWPQDDLGRHLGYLPQEVELFEGTVAENIARLSAPVDSSAVIAAAKQAGAHGMIVGLPDGYDTQIGPDGITLSAGQRQRIGLARALFGQPFLVVLDEPTSNLDADGDEALLGAIAGCRKRGAIVIVIAHRPGAIAACDQVLVISGGTQAGFGPRGEILRDQGRGPVRVATS